MRGADGERLGYIGVMSRRRLESSDDENAALRDLRLAGGAELERRRHETALRARDTEVTASRARLVHAADEERRRIGRNLHDGAQQRLIVLGHRIDLAQRKLADAPEEAAEMLTAAREEARAASQELRELSRGLHPAGLSEYGLEPALQGLAASSPVPLKIGALPDRRLPDVLEVTLYYLVSEALANAIKYADAAEVAVEVTLHAGHARRRGVRRRRRRRGRTSTAAGCAASPTACRRSGAGWRSTARRAPARALRASIPLAPWRSTREPFLDYGHEGDGGLGERLIELIRAGRKTVTVSLAREWDLEGGPPRIGQRLPVIDHHGRKRACVEVVRVTVVPFAEIGPDVVDAEAAGAGSHEEWRAAQRELYDSCREEMAHPARGARLAPHRGGADGRDLVSPRRLTVLRTLRAMQEEAGSLAHPARRQRAHAGAAARRARSDDRLDRAADDRRRPRRAQPPVVGGDRLPARGDGRDAARTASSATSTGARSCSRARS